MEGWGLILIWTVCVIVGAVVGFLLGYLLWKLGFELIGSAVALVGAGLGGIIMFFLVLRWQDSREQ